MSRTFTLTIRMEDSSFDAAPDWHLATMLRNAADRIQANPRSEDSHLVHDIDGNVVGSWRIQSHGDESERSLLSANGRRLLSAR